MISFIDEHRDEYGVESICKHLPIAPSTYYLHRSRVLDPELEPKRFKRDRFLCEEIQRVYNANFEVYGAEKVWYQLNREGVTVARCTVERLMRVLGLRGAIRGKRFKTTIRDENSAKPSDLVERNFIASRPNQLWVADITFVATWSGFVHVAFIVDVFSRYIVGWRVSKRATTDFVLDALEQALWSRQPEKGLIHHSDHGSQYLSIRYTERMIEAGIQSSVGSVGDSYDNAMAETINGLYKTEVIRKKGPWKTIDEVEYATLDWVHWFNNQRILKPIGSIPPAEFEENYYNQIEERSKVA